MGRKALLCQLNNTAVSSVRHHPNGDSWKRPQEKIENYRHRNADIAISAALISGKGRKKEHAIHIENRSKNS